MTKRVVHEVLGRFQSSGLLKEDAYLVDSQGTYAEIYGSSLIPMSAVQESGLHWKMI
jgi:hypothetical protein